MLTKPSVASHTINIDSDITGNAYTAVDSACELVAILGTAAGSALFVRVYDADSAADAITANARLGIAANTGESTPFTPAQPMKFTKGIHLVFEQGGSDWGGEVTLVINK